MPDNIDILHLHMLRIGKEPTKASPQNFYGDPAKVVTLSGCSSCVYSGSGTKGPYCGKLQVYGKRCEFYRIAKK